MKKKVFIGVAWPYVNGELHVGHLAGYLLPADICARYNRIVGNDVLMVSGSDCFGTPITVEADKKGVTPRDIVKKYHKDNVGLFSSVLGLSYDLYTKTLEDTHIKITQDFFVKILKDGYIFIDSTEQYFDPAHKKFLPDRYVVGTCPFCKFENARSDQCDSCGKLIEQKELLKPRSSLTNQPVELRKTEHYFLDWPKLQPRLEEYVDKTSPNWKEWVRNQTNSWLKEKLRPRAITRDLDWGVPIPKDRIPPNMVIENIDDKRIYVWFDAVIGYLSASVLWSKISQKSWESFWYGQGLQHYYFMGKDNLVFHTLFWPGQLTTYDQNLHLPDIVNVNMFLDFGGEKFSKSRGIMLKIKDLVQQYGNDVIRFYFTMIMPESRDTSFAFDDLQDKVNNVLVANIGNFIHRTLSMSKDREFSCDHEISYIKETNDLIEKSFRDAKKYLQNCEFRKYLDVIISLSTYGNKYIDKKTPWKLSRGSNEGKAKEIFTELHALLVSLGILLIPILPEASERLFRMMALSLPNSWPEEGREIIEVKLLASSIRQLAEPIPLFQKIALTQASPQP